MKGRDHSVIIGEAPESSYRDRPIERLLKETFLDAYDEGLLGKRNPTGGNLEGFRSNSWNPCADRASFPGRGHSGKKAWQLGGREKVGREEMKKSRNIPKIIGWRGASLKKAVQVTGNGAIRNLLEGARLWLTKGGTRGGGHGL